MSLTIVVFLAAIIVGFFVGGYLFGLAIRLVCGFQPPLGTCVYYIIIIAVIQSVIGFVIGLALDAAGVSNQFIIGGSSLLLNLVVNPLVIGTIVKDSDGTGIGYIKGLLLYLANLVISILLALVCCGIPALIFGGAAAFTNL